MMNSTPRGYNPARPMLSPLSSSLHSRLIFSTENSRENPIHTLVLPSANLTPTPICFCTRQKKCIFCYFTCFFLTIPVSNPRFLVFATTPEICFLFKRENKSSYSHYFLSLFSIRLQKVQRSQICIGASFLKAITVSSGSDWAQSKTVVS